MNPKIEIYSSEHCPYCVKAKALFTKLGQAFEEIRVDLDDDARALMLARSGGARTVPQIFIHDHHIGGCDDLYALYEQGKLNSYLTDESNQ